MRVIRKKIWFTVRKDLAIMNAAWKHGLSFPSAHVVMPEGRVLPWGGFQCPPLSMPRFANERGLQAG